MAIRGLVATDKTSSIRRRFGAGVVLNLVGVVFNQGSTLLSNMLIANILGGETFGKYVMILSTLQYTSAFAGLGMGFTATRYLPELRVRQPARARRILGLCALASGVAGTCITLGLILAAPAVAERSLHTPELTPLLQIGACVVLSTAINSYFTGVLAGLHRYDLVARSGVASGIVYIALCVLGAKFAGLAGAVGGLSASAVAQSVITGWLYRRTIVEEQLTPTYRDLREERAIVGRWVIPGLLNGMTAIPALWLVQLALARQVDGFAQLARYSAAYSLSMVVLFLPNVAYNVGMSLINHARGANSSSDYRRVFWTNLQFTVGVVAIGAFGLAVTGPLVLRGYGPSFRDAYPVLLILLFATIPESLTIAMNQIIQSNDRIWASLFVINVPRDGTIAFLAFALTPRYAAIGAASAYCVGRVLAFITSMLLCRRIGLGLTGPGVGGGAPPMTSDMIGPVAEA